MKAKKDDFANEERVCKKCGDPLRSTSKYKYCDNCRREKAKARKEMGGAAISLCALALSCVPIVRNFIKKD